MSELLRIYDPVECDENGVPLDWERCRVCGGDRHAQMYQFVPSKDEVRAEVLDAPCSTCGGHGSLWAAALAGRRASSAYRSGQWPRFAPPEFDDERLPTDRTALRDQIGAGMKAIEDAGRVMDAEPSRCEGCGHPMSNGTWEDGNEYVGIHAARLDLAERYLRAGQEPSVDVLSTHWSLCDEGCRHLTEHVRFSGTKQPTGTADAIAGLLVRRAMDVEASWRQVDVRTLGWSHDLRSEKLAVLCLRCWAAKG